MGAHIIVKLARWPASLYSKGCKVFCRFETTYSDGKMLLPGLKRTELRRRCVLALSEVGEASRLRQSFFAGRHS